MRKRKVAYLMSLILLGILSLLMLVACGNAPGKVPDDKKTNSGQTATIEENDSRINALVKVWDEAGLNAEIKEKSSSSTLNSMYGCINQYAILLDDQQFTVLEYDLENMNSTAERYLNFIDENGFDSKTDDPTWHNQEFILQNSCSVIENGEVVAEFFIEDHSKSAQILETFQSFK